MGVSSVEQYPYREIIIPDVPMSRLIQLSFVVLALLLSRTDLHAQADYRPGLFLEEDWKEIPAELPITREHVAGVHLELGLYGPGADQMNKRHHAQLGAGLYLE